MWLIGIVNKSLDAIAVSCYQIFLGLFGRIDFIYWSKFDMIY